MDAHVNTSYLMCCIYDGAACPQPYCYSKFLTFSTIRNWKRKFVAIAILYLC